MNVVRQWLVFGILCGAVPGNVAAAEPAATPGQLLIFISLSMPQPVLRRLLVEAYHSDATLAMRGLYQGSFAATLQRLQTLYKPVAENARSAVAIAPGWFQRFDITAVPVYMLLLEPLSRCEAPPCAVPGHFRLAGDAGLPTILERLQEQPEAARYATAMLEKLAAAGLHAGR